MREFGLGGKLHISEVKKGEGDIRAFNDHDFALKISKDLFETAMPVIAQKLGRANLAMLECAHNVLLTDGDNTLGPIENAEEALIEANIPFVKIPRLPKAEDLPSYPTSDCEYFFKPMPVGYGYRTNFLCVEIGLKINCGMQIDMMPADPIYLATKWHQEFVGDKIERVIIETQERDLFGCCLTVLSGGRKKSSTQEEYRHFLAQATKLANSSYLKWGRHIAVQEAFDYMRRQTLASATF